MCMYDIRAGLSIFMDVQRHPLTTLVCGDHSVSTEARILTWRAVPLLANAQLSSHCLSRNRWF